MTAPLPFTEAGIRRAVRGAQSAGLSVAAVQVTPTGGIFIHTGPAPELAPNVTPEQTVEAAQWADA